MSTAEETGILGPLRQLLSDRQSPESRALFIQVASFVHQRVLRLSRQRYADLFCSATHEDIVSDVLYVLMSGALAQFRGRTMGELLSYVRTVSDRRIWRAAQRLIRERDALAGVVGDVVRDWAVKVPMPDQVEFGASESPLSAEDARYLLALLHSGSQAHFARASGVSRAAVTQRLQRIKRRIQELSQEDRDMAQRWLRGSVMDGLEG